MVLTINNEVHVAGAQVHLYGLRVEVASHLCRSLSIIVCSDALDIWDVSDGLKAVGHDRKIPAVISIGHQQAGQASYTGRLQRVNSLSLSKAKAASVYDSTVRGSLLSNLVMCVCRPLNHAAYCPAVLYHQSLLPG